MKKILVISVAVSAFCTMADTWTDQSTGITWTYTVSGNMASVGSGDFLASAVPRTTTGEIAIPSVLGGCPVTRIGNAAFYSCDELTGVSIPNSVTSIGNDAFCECSGLTSVTIPSNVTSIGECVFRGCSGLTKINVSAENPVYSSADGVLFDKDKKALILCPAGTEGDYTIPEGVTSIGDYAFAWCDALTSVTIPECVTNIGYQAFCECGFLGDGVVIVDGCVLVINGEPLASVELPKGTRLIAGGAFENCWDLTSVTIPPSVTSIGPRAFSGCSELKSMTIPSSVTSIGSRAFSGCSGLEDVTISEGVTSIDEWVFCDCSGLKSVTIPPSVTSIGSRAFSGCSGLMKINVAAENPVYSSADGVLFNKNKTALILCPAGREGEYTIPSGVTSIEDWAFYSCWKVESVAIPSSVTNVGDYAFYCCTGLTSMAIPEGVMRIGDYAFHYCTGLTSVTIPSSVISIGDNAFVGCSRMTELAIGEGVMSIGRAAFCECYCLTNVPVPSSVTYIGERAFSGCRELTSVVFGGNAPTVGLGAFSGVTDDCTATVNWGTIGWDDDSDGKWQGLSLNCVGIPPPIVFAAVGYEGAYDRNAHGITISVTEPAEGAIVTYSRTEDGEYTTTPILIGDVTDGVQNVYYKITADGYLPTNGVATVRITRRPDGGPYTETVDGIEWTFMVQDDETEIRGVDRAALEGVVEIPTTLGGRDVTSIGPDVFVLCDKLTGVTIPTCVKSIGAGAFNACGITSVALPSSVTNVGDGAFNDCGALTSVQIPSSVIKIADHMLSGCSKLSNVVIRDGVTSIGVSAFENCTGLSYVSIPSSVRIIGDGAFAGCCGLTSVAICEGVVNIGGYAFLNCVRLTDIKIPSSVMSIGYSAFGGCAGVREFVVDPKNVCYSSQGGVLFNKDKTYLIAYPKAKTGSYDIPSGVTNIANNAFSDNFAITAVTIPSSVVTVGSQAFSGCETLSSVLLTNGVTRIGGNAFSDCAALTNMTIPATVTDIGKWAFYNSALNAIDFEGAPPNGIALAEIAVNAAIRYNIMYQAEWEQVAIECGWENATPYVPVGSECQTEIVDGNIWMFVITNGTARLVAAVAHGDAVIPVVLGGVEVQSIADKAFKGCDDLKSITIPTNVCEVGSAVFTNCAALKKVNLLGGYVSANEDVFAGSPVEVMTIVDPLWNTWYCADGVWCERQICYRGLEGVKVSMGSHWYFTADEVRNSDYSLCFHVVTGSKQTYGYGWAVLSFPGPGILDFDYSGDKRVVSYAPMLEGYVDYDQISYENGRMNSDIWHQSSSTYSLPWKHRHIVFSTEQEHNYTFKGYYAWSSDGDYWISNIKWTPIEKINPYENVTVLLGPTNVYSGAECTQTVERVLVDGLPVHFVVSNNVATSAGLYTMTIYPTSGSFTNSIPMGYLVRPRQITSLPDDFERTFSTTDSQLNWLYEAMQTSASRNYDYVFGLHDGNGNQLVCDSDYRVDPPYEYYSGSTFLPGDYVYKITGIGNYTGATNIVVHLTKGSYYSPGYGPSLNDDYYTTTYEGTLRTDSSAYLRGYFYAPSGSYYYGTPSYSVDFNL